MRRTLAATPVCLGLALSLGAMVVLGGCRKWRTPKPGAAVEPVGVVEAPAIGRGLEIEVWAIEDRGGELARALQGYDEPAAPIDGASARAWRESGFRLVGVPTEELDRLRASMRLVAPVREESLTDATRWRPVARGPRLSGETVTTALGPAPASDGWARLLARAWAAPSVREGQGSEASMRLELVPQIVQPAGGESIERIEARLRGKARAISEDGPVLRALALSAMLPAGQALLIVGEDPSANWSSLAESAPAIEPAQGQPDEAAPVGPELPGEVEPVDAGAGMGVLSVPSARVSSGSSLGSQPAGPGAPEYRTLGEAMLVGGVGVFAERVDGANRLRAGRRAVIVIVPRVSGPYRLLPKAVTSPVEGR